MLDKITSLLVSDAWAMTPPPDSGAGSGGALAAFLPLVIIFVIFYFMLLRPQQKRQKELQAMIESLKKGDKVITTGGIYGLVEAVGDKTVTLKIADNTKVKFGKPYIAIKREGGEEEE